MEQLNLVQEAMNFKQAILAHETIAGTFMPTPFSKNEVEHLMAANAAIKRVYCRIIEELKQKDEHQYNAMVKNHIL